MNKRYLIHCDFCGKRVIVKDSVDLKILKEVPQAPIPRGFRHLEQEDTKKILKALNRERIEREGKGEEFEPPKLDPLKVLPRRKLLKCPCCGRGLVLRKDSTILPEVEEEKPIEEEDYGFGRETSAPGQQVPGDIAGGSPAGRSEIPQ